MLVNWQAHGKIPENGELDPAVLDIPGIPFKGAIASKEVG